VGGHSLGELTALHAAGGYDAETLLRSCSLIPAETGTLAVKVFSCMNGKEILAGYDLPKHFANQAVNQVNFVQLVKAMASECDFLVEVGPGKVLADEKRTVTPTNLKIRKQESLQKIVELAENIDFCIAVGILEALTEKEAVGLLKTLLSSMPSGSVIYAEKYLPTHPARTSMEWFLDFFLSYSSSSEMKNMAMEAGAHAGKTEVIEDPSGSIVTLKITV
jgi:hypothetical protein